MIAQGFFQPSSPLLLYNHQQIKNKTMAKTLEVSRDRVVRTDAIISVSIDFDKYNLSVWLCGGQILEYHYDIYTDLIDSYKIFVKAIEES